MAGYHTPYHKPSRSGGNLWPKAAFALVAGILLGRACTSGKELPAPPPPPPPEVEVEPERVPNYVAVATSLGSSGFAYAPTSERAQEEALRKCEKDRTERQKNFAYVSAEDCKVQAVASNYNGPGCVALLTNDIVYNNHPPVITGSSIDISRTVRQFLASAAGTIYNTKVDPRAQTWIYCVDYYGRADTENAGFKLSRP